MKRCVLISALFSMMNLAHAAPHIWSSGFGMGFSEYSIENEQQQKLKVSCNTGAGQNFDHSATFIDNNFEYQNTDSKYPLTFIFNDTVKISPPGTTKWRNGANAWNNFKDHIASANKIEVFVNSHKVATFTPNQQSIRNIANEIQGCDALW